MDIIAEQHEEDVRGCEEEEKREGDRTRVNIRLADRAEELKSCRTDGQLTFFLLDQSVGCRLSDPHHKCMCPAVL